LPAAEQHERNWRRESGDESPGAVAPTVANTKLDKAVWSDPAGGDPMRAMIPVGRLAESSEIAAAVLCSASDAAAMVNGQVLRVDGGATIHEGVPSEAEGINPIVAVGQSPTPYLEDCAQRDFVGRERNGFAPRRKP
jgi:hypothetical protein